MRRRKAAAIGWAFLGLVWMWEVYTVAYVVIARMVGRG